MTGFNPEMLILAREFRGMTQTSLAEAIDAKQGTMSKIEAGLQSPETFLQKICAELGFPAEFFQQEDRIYGFNSAVFFHRKRHALSDKILRKLHAAMNIARMRVHRLVRSMPETLETFSFRRIEVAEHRDGAEGVARMARAMWHVPPGPIRNMTEVIESAGGVIVPMDFGTRQADAISEWIPGFPPIFLANSGGDITGDRLRLTLAHELGHVLMHSFPDAEMEEQANTFAAEFLMPRREIKASLYNLTLAKLAQLKRIWKVSMAALIQRAHDLNTISDNQRRYLFMALSKRGQRLREPEGTDVAIERASRLKQLAQAHAEIGYSVSDLMKLLLLNDENELRTCYLGVNQLRLIS